MADGIDPTSPAAVPVLDDVVDRYARTFGATDTPAYRTSLRRRLLVANDPRTERYLYLLSVINEWPTRPPLSPVFTWLIRALDADQRRLDAASPRDS